MKKQTRGRNANNSYRQIVCSLRNTSCSSSRLLQRHRHRSHFPLTNPRGSRGFGRSEARAFVLALKGPSQLAHGCPCQLYSPGPCLPDKSLPPVATHSPCCQKLQHSSRLRFRRHSAFYLVFRQPESSLPTPSSVCVSLTELVHFFRGWEEGFYCGQGSSQGSLDTDENFSHSLVQKTDMHSNSYIIV